MRISANLWTQLHTLTLLHLHAEEEGIGLFTIPHLRRNGELDVLIVRRGSIHLYIIRTESSPAARQLLSSFNVKNLPDIRFKRVISDRNAVNLDRKLKRPCLEYSIFRRTTMPLQYGLRIHSPTQSHHPRQRKLFLVFVMLCMLHYRLRTTDPP